MQRLINFVKRTAVGMTLLLMFPVNAYAAQGESSMQSGVSDTIHLGETVGQWVTGIGFCFAGVFLCIKFFALHNAEDDSDVKQAKKRIKWGIIGLIGAACAWGIVTTIKQTYHMA